MRESKSQCNYRFYSYLAVCGLGLMAGCERTPSTVANSNAIPNANATVRTPDVEPTPAEVAASKAALDEAAQRREASERAQNEVGTLPADHPPVADTTTPSGTNSNANATAGAELQYDAPENWRSTPPASPMRLAQYQIGGDGDDGEPLELVVTAFPPTGMMGDVDANVDRWRKQFAGTASEGDEDAGRVVKQEVNGLTVTYFAMTGDFVQPTSMGGTGEAETNQRMLAAIVPTDSRVYFFKLVGDADRVANHEKEFEQLLKTFRVESGE
ncbi:MAG: hypothetical protein AB7N71_05165 [Phycisphaerae bacterium]